MVLVDQKFLKFLRVMALIFAIIYRPYSFIIQCLLFFQRFDMLNTFVMLKKKQHQMKQCEHYLKILKFEHPH